jgi:hypothetical protein
MTNTEPRIITLDEARKIALDQVRYDAQWDIKDNSIPLLEDNYLEAECCWIFFRNRAIVIAPERRLSNGAYCISKKGHARLIADFSSDPVRLHEYLKTMSDYFKAQNL